MDDRLVDTHSGLPAYTTFNHFQLSVPLPPETERTRDRAYLHPDGEPADEFTRYILLRDMCDFFTVLHGRFYREPLAPGSSLDFEGDPATALAQFNRIHPEELEPLPHLRPDGEVLARLRGGDSLVAAWEAYLARRSRSARCRRDPLSLPPSDWRRFVRRRLHLLLDGTSFVRFADSLEEYLCGSDGWWDWVYDPRFADISEHYMRGEEFCRRFNVLCSLANIRSIPVRNRPFLLAPRDEILLTPRGRIKFRFPPNRSDTRRGRRESELLSLVWYVGLHRWVTRKLLPAHCAAVVYEARSYLESPKVLARGRMTQSRAAGYFGVTRRQLQRALTDIRRAEYTDEVFMRVAELHQRVRKRWERRRRRRQVIAKT